MKDAPDRAPAPGRKRSAAHQRRRDLGQLLEAHGITLIDTHYPRLQLLALLAVVVHAAADADNVTPELVVKRARHKLQSLGVKVPARPPPRARVEDQAAAGEGG